MMSEILKTKIAIACPVCNADIPVTLREIGRNATVRCPHGHEVAVRQRGDGIRKLDRAMDDLQRSVDDLNRRLRRLR